MMRMVLALLVGLAACAQGGASEPRESRAATSAPKLEFSARQLPAEAEVPQPSARVVGGDGRVTVEGKLSAPDPCRQLSGALEGSGTDLTLRVSVASTGGICAQVIAAFAYHGTIAGLSPGTYRLRVVHAYPGTGWETRTVADERVTVR
jgi:hypothetical protein